MGPERAWAEPQALPCHRSPRGFCLRAALVFFLLMWPWKGKDLGGGPGRLGNGLASPGRHVLGKRTAVPPRVRGGDRPQRTKVFPRVSTPGQTSRHGHGQAG